MLFITGALNDVDWTAIAMVSTIADDNIAIGRMSRAATFTSTGSRITTAAIAPSASGSKRNGVSRYTKSPPGWTPKIHLRTNDDSANPMHPQSNDRGRSHQTTQGQTK